MFPLHKVVSAVFINIYQLISWLFLLPSQIRETVLTFVSQTGAHQELLKTKCLEHLKQLVVLHGQPDRLKDPMDSLLSQNW